MKEIFAGSLGKLCEVKTAMSLLTDFLVVTVSQVLFFAGGWVFFMKKLFKDYEASNGADFFLA